MSPAGFRNKRNEVSAENSSGPSAAQRPPGRGSCGGWSSGSGLLTLAPPLGPGPQRIKEWAGRCGPGVKHRDVDVNRTFRNNLFWERYGIKGPQVPGGEALDLGWSWGGRLSTVARPGSTG